MGSKRKRQGVPYPPEFKQRIVALARSGRSPESIQEAFDVSAQSVRNWVRQADRDEGRSPDDGLTTDEREELRRLRREVEDLREERDILKKAAAWFAQEANVTPPKRSGS